MGFDLWPSHEHMQTVNEGTHTHTHLHTMYEREGEREKEREKKREREMNSICEDLNFMT